MSQTAKGLGAARVLMLSSGGVTGHITWTPLAPHAKRLHACAVHCNQLQPHRMACRYSALPRVCLTTNMPPCVIGNPAMLHIMCPPLHAGHWGGQVACAAVCVTCTWQQNLPGDTHAELNTPLWPSVIRSSCCMPLSHACRHAVRRNERMIECDSGCN